MYVTADSDAYGYFAARGAELFAEPEEFDGRHGLLAYNRTDQEKGRATIHLPVCEWIVAVGQHPGLIPGTQWVKVQEMLERNKVRAFRKPRTNEALLTGLLRCRCGAPMYPKLSSRRTGEGTAVFSYVCKMKERSRGSLCHERNVSGNGLDAAVLAQVRALTADPDALAARLEQGRRLAVALPPGNEESLAALRKEKREAERRLAGLVDSLADLDDGTARSLVCRRIGEMNEACEALERRISELCGESCQHPLTADSLACLRRQFSAFPEYIVAMSLQQRRAALQALLQQVVWDGCQAELRFCGCPEEPSS